MIHSLSIRFLLLFTVLVWGFEVGAAKKSKPAPKPKLDLEKTPKALFLIKRAKISSEVGEPQFYPGQNQLRTIINEKKFRDLKAFR